jgi:hypothetical protein
MSNIFKRIEAKSSLSLIQSNLPMILVAQYFGVFVIDLNHFQGDERSEVLNNRRQSICQLEG